MAIWFTTEQGWRPCCLQHGVLVGGSVGEVDSVPFVRLPFQFHTLCVVLVPGVAQRQVRVRLRH